MYLHIGIQISKSLYGFQSLKLIISTSDLRHYTLYFNIPIPNKWIKAVRNGLKGYP